MKRFIAAVILTLALAPFAFAADLSPEGQAAVDAAGGPFSSSEFTQFLGDLPHVPGLSRRGQEDMGEMSSEMFAPTVLKAIRDLGWKEERFMYIYSHVMAVMSLDQMDQVLARMEQQMATMPPEQREAMEQMMGQQLGLQKDAIQSELDSSVPTSEQSIVRSGMDGVYTALGIPRQN